MTKLFLIAPPPDSVTDGPAEQPSDGVAPTNDYNNVVTDSPSALAGNENAKSSNGMLYIIGLIAVFVIVGVIAFIIIRKRKQTTDNTEVSPVNSMASSNLSDADMYRNA
jgi:hypothetical protein